MTTVEPHRFGDLLKRYRRAAGLTQEGLAERAGLSTRGISDLERGVSRTHRADTVERLAVALGLSARERGTFEQAALGVGDLALDRPDAPAHVPDDHVPLLVGRNAELALLERHLAGQCPPLLLFAGEPGIGKSRLLREATRRAAERGWRVLQGGCSRRGGQQPFAPLLGALERYVQRRDPLQLRSELRGCAWLVRLLPELADGPIEPLPAWTLPPEQERRLIVAALTRFLANVAGPGGVLLVLDDLQWAGADALDLLGALVRAAVPTSAPAPPSTDGTPLLRVVGAYRSTEIQPQDPLSVLLADLAHAELLTHHTLDVLTSDDAARLFDDLLAGAGDTAQTLRAQVLRRAGGVPFFLVSCARGLHSAAVRADLPWDLAQSIRQRVAALPDPARQVLGVAAVAGRQVSGPLLVAAAAQPEEAVLAVVEAACRAHLLDDAGPEGYRFTHDVIREVIEGDLGTVRRMALHRRVAAVLEVGPGARPIEALAYHYVRGGLPDKAVPYLEQAGDKARAQAAHAAAADYYRHEVECLDELGRPAEAAAAREKLGNALATMAHYDAALAVFEQAITTYQAAGDLEGLQRTLAAIGQVHAHRGTPEEGLQRLQPLLDPQAMAATPPIPGPGLAALYVALAHLCLLSGRYPEQLAAAERAVDLARTLGDDRLLAAAQYERGFALTERSAAEALPPLEEASRLAEAVGDLDTLCYALDCLSGVYEDCGEFGPARQYTERALAVAERQGDPALLVYLRTRRGMSAFLSGAWIQAHADYEEALALSRRVGESWAAPFPLHDLGRLCLAEGAWAEAEAYLEESSALATRSGNVIPLRQAQLVLAERDVLDGQPEAACARLMPLLDRSGLEEQQVAYLLPTLAWAHLERGAVDQAATVVEQAVQRARAGSYPRARAGSYPRALVYALRVQVLVCTRQQRWSDAAHSFEEGLTLSRRLPYPYAEARLLYAAGLMHAEKGEPGPARVRLEAALAIFRRLGARKDAEWAERLMAGL